MTSSYLDRYIHGWSFRFARKSKCSHISDLHAGVRFISAGLLKLSFQSLQCQSNDSGHAAIERIIFQTYKTVKGQSSPSNYSFDPCLVESVIILGT